MKVTKKLFLLGYRLISGLLMGAAAVLLILLLLGIRPYVVETGSMEPAIPAGSLSFVDHRARLEEVRAGDIIAFRKGDLLVTHRAVSVDPAGITTRGDANNTEDASAKVTEENFVGKTVFWVPWAGRVLRRLRTLPGKLALAGFLLLFLGCGLLYDRVRSKE